MTSASLKQFEPRFSPRSPARAQAYPGIYAAEAQAAEPLPSMLTNSLGQVSGWRRGQVQADQAEAQRSLVQLRRDRQALQELEGDIANSQNLMSTAKRLRVEVTKYGRELKASLAVAAEGTANMQTAFQTLLGQDTLRRKEATEAEEELSAQRNVTASRMAQVEVLLNAYRQRLGLDFSSAGGEVKACRVVFSLLDPQRPEREFVATLGLDDFGGYQVFDCSPEVPELGKLLCDLNEAVGDQAALAVFMCGLRRAFQKAAPDA